MDLPLHLILFFLKQKQCINFINSNILINKLPLVQNIWKNLEETTVCVKQGAGNEGKTCIYIPHRKVKQACGIIMNSFCLCLGKEMTVKNFTKVVKKFLSVLIFQKGKPSLLLCKCMHFYNSPSNQQKYVIRIIYSYYYFLKGKTVIVTL